VPDVKLDVGIGWAGAGMIIGGIVLGVAGAANPVMIKEGGLLFIVGVTTITARRAIVVYMVRQRYGYASIDERQLRISRAVASRAVVIQCATTIMLALSAAFG
jgi:hypothetical protein